MSPVLHALVNHQFDNDIAGSRWSETDDLRRRGPLYSVPRYPIDRLGAVATVVLDQALWPDVADVIARRCFQSLSPFEFRPRRRPLQCLERLLRSRARLPSLQKIRISGRVGAESIDFLDKVNLLRFRESTVTPYDQKESSNGDRHLRCRRNAGRFG